MTNLDFGVIVNNILSTSEFTHGLTWASQVPNL